VYGTKYDVYYFDNFDYPYVLDEENLGDKAEVVNIDGKLYIKLITSTLKPFVLECEISDEYKKAIDKISVGGVYLFPAVNPSDSEFFPYETMFHTFNKGDRDIDIMFVGMDQKHEKNYMKLSFDNIEGETHIVGYKWIDGDLPKQFKNKLEKIEKNILKNNVSLDKLVEGRKGVYFELDDLSYINYLVNTNYDEENGVSFNDAVNYSSQLKEIFENTNLKFYLDYRAANGSSFVKQAYGFLTVEYSDLLYFLNFQGGIYIKQVIYIPDSTEDTDSAYIAEAKRRIVEYLGVDDIEIEVAGSRDELTASDPEVFNKIWNVFYDEDNLSDNYYNIIINGRKYQFVFEKNSKKIKKLGFKSKDLVSDIEINSNSSQIPSDSLIEVNEITKDNQEFDKILKKLNKDFGMIFDLKLYSNSKNKYINQLDNGIFEVRIPLKEEFKDKNLRGYYIKDNNDIEEYDVIVEDGYAVFKTNHFSTYIITEYDEKIINPPTGSITILSIIIAFISLMIIILLKRKNLKI